MKRLYLLLSVILIVVTLILPINSQASTDLTFKDIEGHWAENAIQFLVERKLLNGYSDDTFRPNRPITRAEASTVIVNELNLYENSETTIFPDSENHWASKFIASAVSEGIITGYTDGTFRPNKALTRAELSVILVRAYELTINSDSSNKSYSDIYERKWYFKSVDTLIKKNLVGGYTDGTFRPNAKVSRGEFSAFMKRILKQTEETVPNSDDTNEEPANNDDTNNEEPSNTIDTIHADTPPSIDNYGQIYRTGGDPWLDEDVINLLINNYNIGLSEREIQQAFNEVRNSGDVVYLKHAVFYYSSEPFGAWEKPIFVLW